MNDEKTPGQNESEAADWPWRKHHEKSIGIWVGQSVHIRGRAYAGEFCCLLCTLW